MVSNVLVWLALALPLEHAYGTPRILAVWLISALGSAFFSAAFEDSCTLVCSELCPSEHPRLVKQNTLWQPYSAAFDNRCLQLSETSFLLVNRQLCEPTCSSKWYA